MQRHEDAGCLYVYSEVVGSAFIFPDCLMQLLPSTVRCESGLGDGGVLAPTPMGPCPDFKTSWHGSNLYVAGSIIKTGKMLPSYGDSGRKSGIWSMKSSNRRLCGSYMYYILSGSGVAWSVMFELKIDPNHTKKGGSSSHQYCTEEGHATVHAAWFHGVTQDDFFPGMYIWPTWNPDLELMF